ncbi:TraK family protein [Halodesulfovibrio sp.]|jgi:hypothetical protein|uniref:TraK family protein n=1 Tax=Halodesulfovibrio sp. TaxID=1912772 RepID=UPI0025F09E09|nr:TraK family protein [Halodesulfovibrio sp.]MCT4533742.1 TraK family protein [Halodesulfovibrio sp.]
MPKKQKGFAKVEYLAARPEITTLLTAGHTFRSAYTKLADTGKITMSYQRFVWYARNGAVSRLDSTPAKKSSKADMEQQPSLHPLDEKSVKQATATKTKQAAIPKLPPGCTPPLGVTATKKGFKEMQQSIKSEDIF